MKNGGKYVLVIVMVLLWGFIYAGFEENKNENVDDLKKREVIGNITDNVMATTEGNLNIYFLDVGQADAILLENNNKYMMIDAGNNADGENIVKYLKELGVSKLDYLIATHAHEDHIGGMDDVVNSFSIGTFFMPDVVTTTKTFEDLIESLENNSISVEIPKIGDVFLFEGCKFEVLYLADEKNLNDTSIVVRGLYGKKSFLFMGDATTNVEKKILNKNIDSDVLKVGHHGSRYSTGVNFLKKVTPDVAIISVGKNNSYNHPHGVTFTKLNDYDVASYRTDKDGTILISTDGKTMSIDKLAVNLNG